MNKETYMSEWIEFKYNDPDTHPEEKKDLWYFFKYVGVHKGQYYGDWTFAGKSGFLGGDVTHWQYDNGQEMPERPKGYEKE